MNTLVSYLYSQQHLQYSCNKLELPSGKQVLITHNYGHGGSGFQSSWGTAQEAVRLIKQGNNALQNDTKDIRKLLSRL